jgi:hypothetical protein
MRLRRRGQAGVGHSVEAVVVEYVRGRTSGETPPESFRATMRVDAVVRVAADDRTQPVSGRVTGLVLWMMAEGDTVPVLVDDTGRVTGFDRPAIEELYRSQKAELKASLRPHTVINDLRREAGLDREQLADVGPALRDLASVPKKWFDAVTAPTDVPAEALDPAPPIDGVSFSTFVTVQATLVRERVPPDRHDEVAQRHGVPAGAWASAGPAWMARTRSDPAVGRAFGAAYAAALRT